MKRASCVASTVDSLNDFTNFKENRFFDFRYRFYILHTFSRTFVRIANAFFNSANLQTMNPVKIRPYCEKLLGLLRNRKGEDLVLFEKVTAMIYDFAQKSPLFLKEYRKDVLEIFESDEFFNCSIAALKTWSLIIDLLLDVNKLDILSDHLEALPHQRQLLLFLPLAQH